jgi:hypothetical protein
MADIKTFREKYSCFYFSEIVVLYRHPASSKRDVRVVTIRGVRGAVDATGGAGRAPMSADAKSCGPGVPVLTPSLRCDEPAGDGGNQAVPGEITYKR